MARLAQEEEDLQMELDGLKEQMDACYATMERIRSDRAKQIDELRQQAKELEKKQVHYLAEIENIGPKKEMLESHLEVLSTNKSHVDFAVSLLLLRDPGGRISEDIQPAVRRFQVQLSAFDQEIRSLCQHLAEFAAPLKSAVSNLARNDAELTSVQAELNALVSSIDSSRSGPLVEKQKGLIVSCRSLEEKLSSVARKIRLLRLETFINA